MVGKNLSATRALVALCALMISGSVFAGNCKVINDKCKVLDVRYESHTYSYCEMLADEERLNGCVREHRNIPEHAFTSDEESDEALAVGGKYTWMCYGCPFAQP